MKGSVRVGKRWRDYTPRQRLALSLLAAVELGFAAAAWTDLARRDQAEVRGPKWVWALVIAVNIVGPLAYFRWGRRPGAGGPPGEAVAARTDRPSAPRVG